MSDREQRERNNTFVPRTPQDAKPKSSRDNVVEMAAGGKAERAALDAREDKLAEAKNQPPRPLPRDAGAETPVEQMTAPDLVGRTDSPEGTGVGYAGEGAASYGTQGATGQPNTLADAPTNPQGQAAHTGDTTRTTAVEHERRHDQTQQQEEMQHMAQSSSSEDKGKGQTQQSTGSGTPSQGTGSTAQSHSGGTGAQHSANSGAPTSHSTHSDTTVQGKSEAISGGSVIGGSKKESATDAAAETLASAKGHVEPAATSVTGHAQGAASDVKGHAQDAATGVKEHAQAAAGDVRDHAQQAVSDVKDRAASALSDAQSDAQDRLQSVKATLQTKSDQVKETLTGLPDQFKGTVGERGEQAKQAANQTATQAGGKLTDLATTLREKTQTLEPESPVSNVAAKAAGALEQTGSYLQQSTPDDWVGDLKRVISRKPLESVLIAAGIGYLFARAFRGGGSSANND